MGKQQEVILFILEGKKPEQQITDSLRRNQLLGSSIIEVLFEADIHQLYKILKNDEYLDVIGYFIENSEMLPEQRARLVHQKSSIAQVFLFFDLDAHSNKYCAQTIFELLQFFNNETENGKLFISYPMVECIKYLESDIEAFCKLTYAVSAGTAYKSYVDAQTNKTEFSDFRKYDVNIWKKIVQFHCFKANFLVYGVVGYPKKSIPQTDIYYYQYEQYIQQNSSVLTLSAFPLFLLDFYGSETLANRLFFDSSGEQLEEEGSFKLL